MIGGSRTLLCWWGRHRRGEGSTCHTEEHRSKGRELPPPLQFLLGRLQSPLQFLLGRLQSPHTQDTVSPQLPASQPETLYWSLPHPLLFFSSRVCGLEVWSSVDRLTKRGVLVQPHNWRGKLRHSVLPALVLGHGYMVTRVNSGLVCLLTGLA